MQGEQGLTGKQGEVGTQAGPVRVYLNQTQLTL